MLKKPGMINGGIGKKGGNLNAPSFAINVDDLDKSIQKVKDGGGTVITDKIEVGDMGTMAYFKDTEGNVISLWQNKQKM